MSVNLIWNPQPGFGSSLQTLLALKWSLWSPPYSVVYLRDRLPVITQQSALAVCGTVPVFNLSLLWLGFTVEAKVLCNKLLSDSTELPQRCIWCSGSLIQNTWMGNLFYTVDKEYVFCRGIKLHVSNWLDTGVLYKKSQQQVHSPLSKPQYDVWARNPTVLSNLLQKAKDGAKISPLLLPIFYSTFYFILLCKNVVPRDEDSVLNWAEQTDGSWN